MSAPTVPQRPTRSQNPTSNSSNELSAPHVPPRPNRNLEKSKSPSREGATRSPLNDSLLKSPGASMTPTDTLGEPASKLQKRPSIQSLPLVGHEGEEYASLDQVPQIKNLNGGTTEPSTPQDTRSVSGDLPLHAPKASSGTSSRAQVAPVVRTDTATAAELGIGKTASEPNEPHDLHLHHTASRSKDFRPASSSGLAHDITRELSRSESRSAMDLTEEEEEEHGIPHIGQQVPMYPNAGDVQAPSPAPWQSQQSTGIGFFNDASKTPKDARRKSAQGFHGPPGSYGLHGHGHVHPDKFEKAWYEKHPEELKKEEQGAYGPHAALQRGEWALSSDELNKLVRGNSEGGFGTSDEVISVPTEAVGHKATQEYHSRMNSPALQPTKSRTGSQGHIDSPLRNATLPGGNELDNDHVTLDPPPMKADNYTGQGMMAPSSADLGPQGGNTQDRGGYLNERGTGTPILASDETQNRPGSEFLQPAVSPEDSKHANDEYFSDSDTTLPAWQRRPGNTGGRSRSRPSSRPSSAQFHHHDLHSTGTPLNEIDEYEPLFIEEEDGQLKKRPTIVADKLKGPGLEQTRFPSKDIWEDTPTSLQLETIVGGPQEPEEKSAISQKQMKGSALFEPPEKEAARRGEVTESERMSFLDDANNQQKAKPKFKSGVQDEVAQRPGMARRFPSRDIWEDTPDSAQLSTTIDPEEGTVKSPHGETITTANSLAGGFAAADKALAAPEANKPSVPVRPSRSKAEEQPSVPQRPARRQASDSSPTKTEAQSTPDRPKPQVPARPHRGSQAESDQGANLSKALSSGSGSEVTSPTEGTTSTKAKPAVPSKPTQSSKFASIKAGFMNDLNSRLQLGPQAKKAEAESQGREMEEEKEKAPLADARKGRARGPARRKPEVASSSSVTQATSSTWGFAAPKTSWSIDEAGLNVFSSDVSSTTESTSQQLGSTEAESSPLAAGTTDGTADIDRTVPHPSDPDTDQHAREEAMANRVDVKQHEESTNCAEVNTHPPMPAETSSAEKTTQLSGDSTVETIVQTSETKIGRSTEEHSGVESMSAVEGGQDESETVLADADLAGK